MKKIVLFCFLFFPVLLFARDRVAKDASAAEYKPHELVYRLKESFRGDVFGNSVNVSTLKNLFKKLKVTETAVLFPRSQKQQMEKNREGKQQVDLSLIFHLRFLSDVDVSEAVKWLRSNEAVEYAEPLYLHEAFYTPNDPQISQQYFLSRISAFAGWDISKGDTNTVIGIVDSGTDWDHPDLQPNIKLNFADPVNGTDDDGDGFTDNYRGWDVSQNDNNPMVGVQRHGSHVSGCASAATDNGTGVAGPGFLCRLLPVKASYDASATSIDHGYEGIIYAADHGCSVINCSWGRRGGPSQFEQDVINYATINRNALVVAAAGNQGRDADFYPASYSQVLSVAATDSIDEKAGFSNYSYKVDLTAPGDIIYSTYFDNIYTTLSGTSMAAPVTAGCAAVVKSLNPAFTAAQVAARMRATSDDIYATGSNSNYLLKLGKGRINLFRALSDSLTPGIEVSNLKIDDANDNAFFVNDTLRISALFRNLLHVSAGLTVTLSTTSSGISLLNSSFNAGVLNTFDSISNLNLPFQVKILSTAPLNSIIHFVMTITDGSYSDFYAFSTTVNVDFLNITVNDISTTVNSKGRIGYNLPDQTEGLGFSYLSDVTLLFEAGLMIGTSATKVSDPVAGAGAANDDDFFIVARIATLPSVVSSFDAAGKFNDAASSSPIPVAVSQYIYAWDNDPYRKFIIVKYAIRNTGTTTLTGLRAGIFADWDIADYFNNKCSMDAGRKMGYTWSTDTGLYAGIKVLSATLFNQYAIDNESGGLGGLDLTNGFTTAEKYLSMSTSRTDAGVPGAGNDVIDVVSTGPFTIAVADSAVVTFALIAGDSLASIQQSADDAQALYDSLLTAIPEIHGDRRFSINTIYPNPAAHTATVSFSLDDYGLAELDVFDITGRKIAGLFSEKLPSGEYRFTADVSALRSGIYFLRLTHENRAVTARVLITNPY